MYVPASWSVASGASGCLIIDREAVSVPAVDPVTLTIVSNYLANVCHEMGVAMMKTSLLLDLQRGTRLLLRGLRR